MCCWLLLLLLLLQVLRHQWGLLQSEQQKALHRLPLPAAFVTFK
jgi:hypothetical protein